MTKEAIIQILNYKQMKILNLKNYLFLASVFAIFLFITSCGQSSKESDNNATNVASKTSTNDTNTTEESIADVINTIRYTYLDDGTEGIADHKASYPKSNNNCFLKVVAGHQFINEPDSRTEDTQTLNLKDLDASTLKIVYEEESETYALYINTRGNESLVKSTLGTPNEVDFSRDGIVFGINSDAKDILLKLKKMFLKKIQDCHCANTPSITDTKTSFEHILQNINDIQYTEKVEGQKVDIQYKTEYPTSDNPCFIKLVEQ